jgi:MFS family permease
MGLSLRKIVIIYFAKGRVMNFKKSFYFLIACEVVMVAGHSLSFPFFAVYLNTHRGMAMSFIGIFLAVSMFMSSFAQIIGGEISDIIGRKKVMFFSLASRGIVIGIIAWLIKTDGSTYLIMAFHVLGLFVGSFLNPAVRGWVADFTDSAERMRAYGLLRIGINLGWAIGPAIGGFMAMESYSKMFFLTFLTYLFCSMVILAFIKDTPVCLRRKSESIDFKDLSSVLNDRRFIRFCVYVTTMSVVMSQLVVSLSLYSVTYLGFRENEIGILFSINGVMVVALQYFATRILENFRITNGLAAGAVFYAVGYLVFGFSNKFHLAVAGVMIFTIGEIFVSPGMHALSANMAEEKYRGRYMGIQGLFHQIGHSCGLLFGTTGIQFLSPHFQQAPWIVIVCIALFSCAGFYKLKSNLNETENGLKKKTFVKFDKPIEV